MAKRAGYQSLMSMYTVHAVRGSLPVAELIREGKITQGSNSEADRNCVTTDGFTGSASHNANSVGEYTCCDQITPGSLHAPNLEVLQVRWTRHLPVARYTQISVRMYLGADLLSRTRSVPSLLLQIVTSQDVDLHAATYYFDFLRTHLASIWNCLLYLLFACSAVPEAHFVKTHNCYWTRCMYHASF